MYVVLETLDRFFAYRLVNDSGELFASQGRVIERNVQHGAAVLPEHLESPTVSIVQPLECGVPDQNRGDEERSEGQRHDEG